MVNPTSSLCSQMIFSGSGSFLGDTAGTGTLSCNSGGGTTIPGNINHTNPEGYFVYIDAESELVLQGMLGLGCWPWPLRADAEDDNIPASPERRENRTATCLSSF